MRPGFLEEIRELFEFERPFAHLGQLSQVVNVFQPLEHLLVVSDIQDHRGRLPLAQNYLRLAFSGFHAGSPLCPDSMIPSPIQLAKPSLAHFSGGKMPGGRPDLPGADSAGLNWSWASSSLK